MEIPVKSDTEDLSAEAKWTRREINWLACVSLGFGALFSYPMLVNLHDVSVQYDWDFESELHWVAYYTVAHFHQFPIWNPYKCGGMGMLANPQSRFLTPFFLLHLLLGPSVGAHLEVILHLSICWAGCYVLARELGMRPVAAAVAGTAFSASSWFPLHIGEGHLVMLPFAYLPWFLVLMMLAVKTAKWTPSVVAGALFAITFGEGGVLIFIYASPLIALFAMYLCLELRSSRPMTFLAAAGIFGATLSAVKLLPSYELVVLHPRQPWGFAFSTWSNIAEILFSHDQARHAEGDRFFVEFGTYVSPTFWLLAIVGIVFFRKRIVPWVLATGLMLWLVRGDNAVVPLWTYLKALPLYSMMRIPSRFFIVLAFCIALIAASGADEIQHRMRRRGQILVAVLLGIGALDSFVVGTPFLRHAFDRKGPDLPYSTAFRQFDDVYPLDMTLVARADMGFVSCYEYTQWITNVLGWNDPGYKGEQYMEGPGSARLLYWTPNVLRYQVETPAESIMKINQNYDAAWRLVRGRGRLFSDGGLLAVEVPPGRQAIELVCRGTAFLVGAFISLAALLVGVSICLAECRESRTSRGRT